MSETPTFPAASAGARALLRHTLAVIAYRGGKAIRNAPPEFATYQASPTSRRPLEILSHVADLIAWFQLLAKGEKGWSEPKPTGWEEQRARFFTELANADALLASDRELAAPAEKLFQGPLADALTHVGQINLLRRMAGGAVRGENYFVADITTGRVGDDQPRPNREFD